MTQKFENLQALDELSDDQLVRAFDAVHEAAVERMTGDPVEGGAVDALRRGVPLIRESLSSAMEDRPLDPDRIGLPPRDELSPPSQSPELIEDPQTRERLGDGLMGRLKDAVDGLQKLPFMRADEIARKAHEAERRHEAEANHDPSDLLDLDYALELNATLSDIQDGTVAPEARFRVTPEFFTTEHLETSNVLMNIADRASPGAREAADMLGGLAGLKELQQSAGLHPADAMLPTVRNAAADAARHAAEGTAPPENELHGMELVLDVAQSAGHFNPYPHANGGQLYADDLGKPVRENLDVAYGRSLGRSPVGREIASGRAEVVDGRVDVELAPGDAFRQFEIDAANARMAGHTGGPGLTRLLESGDFAGDLRELTSDIKGAGAGRAALEGYRVDGRDEPGAAADNAFVSVKGLVQHGEALEERRPGSVDTEAVAEHLSDAARIQHEHDYRMEEAGHWAQETRVNDARELEMETGYGYD